MILLFMSFLDFLVILTLLGFHFFSPPASIGLYAASYLLLKNVLFYTNFVSYIDGVIGLWLIGMVLFGFQGVFTFLACIFLLSKVVASLI